METKILMPFHESCIQSLSLVEKNLLEIISPGIGDIFICRFRMEIKPLLELIKITAIPEKHLTQVIEGIKSFYQGFESRYDRAVRGFRNKEERRAIDSYFADTINTLERRRN